MDLIPCYGCTPEFYEKFSNERLEFFSVRWVRKEVLDFQGRFFARIFSPKQSFHYSSLFLMGWDFEYLGYKLKEIIEK